MTDKMTAEQAITELAAFHVNGESGLHLLSVIRQALTAPRVQWKPIDTAPTDGTHVLVLLKSGSVMQAEFWDFWMPVYFSSTKIEPTHWTALPALPEVKK